MGLHRLPRINDYWSRNRVFRTEIITNTMPRKEFYRIFPALHLLDSAKENQFAKSSNYSKFSTSFIY